MINNSHTPRAYIGLHLHLSDSHTSDVAKLKENIPELAHIQVFTHGPQSTKKIKIDADFTTTLNSLNISMNVHGSYLCVPWRSSFLMHHTLENFRAAHSIRASDVVIHIPFMPINDWLISIVELTMRIKKERLSPKIMLETSATISHAKNSYETPPKLNRLWRAIQNAKISEYCGICIDTAHIHAGGVQIRTYDDAHRYLDMCTPGMIQSIQLNGNSIAPGIHNTSDMHEIPLSSADLIWRGLSYRDSGCRAFIEYSVDHNIPCTIEWNKNRHSVDQVKTFLSDIVF